MVGCNVLVIGFTEGGGKSPGWCGDFAYSAFQSSCISPPGGDFFLAKSPVLGEARHATGLQDALQDFILVLSRVNKHSRLHVLTKIELLLLFLEYSARCSKWLLYTVYEQSGENSNFYFRREFPTICSKSVRTDDNTGEHTIYHHDSFAASKHNALHLTILVNISTFFYP